MISNLLKTAAFATALTVSTFLTVNFENEDYQRVVDAHVLL